MDPLVEGRGLFCEAMTVRHHKFATNLNYAINRSYRFITIKTDANLPIKLLVSNISY